MRMQEHDMTSTVKGLICRINIKNYEKARCRIFIARPFFAFACWIAGLGGVEINEE